MTRRSSMKIVAFEWCDAFANSGWFDRGELPKVTKAHFWCHTAGILVERTEDAIVVCTTWVPGDGALTVEKFGNIQKIPLTWVRNYRVLDTTIKRAQ